MKKSATEFLRDFSLRVTTPRVALLELMLATPSKAFTYSEFYKGVNKKVDRSTIYRTLNKFIEVQVIHKMLDAEGQLIYSLKEARTCNHHAHPHLKCNSCGSVECLPNYPTEYVKQLTTSGVNEMNVVLSGVCHKCRSKN